jgi:hypothetical protein
MRDVQRMQVYRGESDWERVAGWMPCDPHAEWERIRRDPWFVEQFPWTARNVELAVTRRGTSSWACWQTRLIGIHHTMQNRHVVLHEVAHIATWERFEGADRTVAAHGPEFVAVLLSLTARFVSVQEAAGLSQALRQRGVARWPGEKRRRPVTPRPWRVRWDTTRVGDFKGRDNVRVVIAVDCVVTHDWTIASMAEARRFVRNIAERAVEDNPGCEVRVVFTKRNYWDEVEGQETWSHRSVSSASAAA